MKKVIILLSLLFPMIAAAENASVTESDTLTSIVEKIVKQKIKSKINIDFCTSLNGTFSEDTFDGISMKMNRLRIDMRGRISDNFSYRVRQSFNKSYTKASLDNVPASLEYANIQWLRTNCSQCRLSIIETVRTATFINMVYLRAMSHPNSRL